MAAPSSSSLVRCDQRQGLLVCDDVLQSALQSDADLQEGFQFSPGDVAVVLPLCIFLGVLGVHRYYVGKIGTGVIWTLTAGFFGIGWIVDIFTVALGGFYDANGYVIRFRPTEAELAAEEVEEDAPVDIDEE